MVKVPAYKCGERIPGYKGGEEHYFTLEVDGEEVWVHIETTKFIQGDLYHPTEQVDLVYLATVADREFEERELDEYVWEAIESRLKEEKFGSNLVSFLKRERM